MIRERQDGFWLELQEDIAAHHEEVFSLLSTSGGLSRWFPVAAEIDLQAGGRLVLGWDAKMRRKSTVTILSHDPGGKIAWDWHADMTDIHVPIYWEVRPEREKGSVLLFRQGPYRDDRESLRAMANEASSWQWLICNLRAVLEASYDMRKHRPL